MDYKDKKIALIAGGGDLPLMVYNACVPNNSCNKSSKFSVVFISGQENQSLQHLCQLNNTPYLTAPLGQFGKILSFWQHYAAEFIVFAGHIHRPSLQNLSLDLVGARWLKKLGTKIFQGDDTLLKGIIELVEAEGLKVISAQQILSNLIPQLEFGTLTVSSPSPTDKLDIERGISILSTLAKEDVGQSVIIQQGLVLGIEAIEGTDALIERAGTLKKIGGGGVLVKMPKKQQTSLIDFPTIGPETVIKVNNAGLSGIAAKAYIINQDQTIELANQHDIFLQII